jgi:hypothetical protein
VSDFVSEFVSESVPAETLGSSMQPNVVYLVSGVHSSDQITLQISHLANPNPNPDPHLSFSYREAVRFLSPGCAS